MDNNTICHLLELQRDQVFEKLKSKPISVLYKEMYKDIKAGRMFVFDNKERKVLQALKKLGNNPSFDISLAKKLNEYVNLDNDQLITYFQTEFGKILNQMTESGKIDEMQALFIEYDYYYHFTSCVTCYGLQEYPFIVEPRYITNEYDYNKEVWFLQNGINFQPAWKDCEEFEGVTYLNINYEIESLFKLHSRVLLHKALVKLGENKKLDVFRNRPFSFYINEHDNEVMILYRVS